MVAGVAGDERDVSAAPCMRKLAGEKVGAQLFGDNLLVDAVYFHLIVFGNGGIGLGGVNGNLCAARTQAAHKVEGIAFHAAAAAENILIEAEHLGLGSIWLQVYPYADRKAHLLNILDIPAEMEPFCIIAIGYAERKPVRMNRYNERIIYNDLYGSRKK